MIQDPWNNNIDQSNDLLNLSLSSNAIAELLQEEQELLFNAELYLSNLGVKVRTEYGNYKPTYNLLLELGKQLKRGGLV